MNDNVSTITRFYTRNGKLLCLVHRRTCAPAQTDLALLLKMATTGKFKLVRKHHQTIANAWIIQTSHTLLKDEVMTGQIYYIMAK